MISPITSAREVFIDAKKHAKRIKINIFFFIRTVYGLGLAIKPSDSLTLLLDYTHVTYSDILDDPLIWPGLEDDLSDFTVDDADEVHAGLEYVYQRDESYRDPGRRVA